MAPFPRPAACRKPPSPLEITMAKAPFPPKAPAKGKMPFPPKKKGK